MLSIVGHRNSGTLDNASGVAAVLEAAEMMPATARVGVLITDAEEMGLAGARAWARGRTPAVALNCDSVDDGGRVTVMHGSPVPQELIAHVREAALAQQEPLRVIRLIPGILTDHVPLAQASWKAVTLSRGDLRTLGRIHTSRDTLDFMRGTGIASVARILARTATELG
jgi:Zn-dependent M28 family amino/carboxypeptidase